MEARAGIGDDLAGRPQARDQARQHGLVGGLTGGQQQANRQPHGIDDGVDLGRQSPTGTADGLTRALFFRRRRADGRARSRGRSDAANPASRRPAPRNCAATRRPSPIDCSGCEASSFRGRSAPAGRATASRCAASRKSRSAPAGRPAAAPRAACSATAARSPPTPGRSGQNLRSPSSHRLEA